MRRPFALIATAALLGVGVLPVLPAAASDPATSELTVPATVGGEVSTAYTGTVNTGASGAVTNSCDAFDSPDRDDHEVTITVPDLGETLTATFIFDIQWGDASSDLVLSVQDEGGNLVGASDGGSPQETVSVENLVTGTYTVSACAFAVVAPTDYEGTITVKVSEQVVLPDPDEDLGMAFSAATVADIQRDESEPLIHIDRDGNVYGCGPTGASQVNEYAQVSTDSGDQFHLLGQYPRGQISEGGGGDCALDSGLERNEAGNYQLAYTGLSALLTFTTATSPDVGATIETNPTSFAYPVVDRQWIAFTDDLTVFHAYNKLLEGVYVQKSTDGGFEYAPDTLISPGAARGPGDVVGMTPDENPLGDTPAVYYPWQLGNRVMLAFSADNGETWNNCTVVASDANPGRLFPVADHDREGNVYVGYTENADDNTYLTAIAGADLANCDGGIDNGDDEFLVEPGFYPPVLVNRNPINSTVFPWLAAGGEPGRVAMTFLGSRSDEHPDVPNTKQWHVYVNQSLNALDPLTGGDARFSQTQVTTHPMHYDSICLGGLSCDTTSQGDRSMADFYAMDYDPRTGGLMVIYNRTHKRPGDGAGQVATPVVSRQIAGPSNGGGEVSVADREALRTATADPTGDAIADYSQLYVAPNRTDVPAADVTNVEVLPAVDPTSGDAFEGGGFTVEIDVADLSDGALQQAAQASRSQSLLYIFRFVDGYRYSAAIASWNPISGWSFGYNGFRGAPTECPANANLGVVVGEDGCLKYPADESLDGAVDGNTIRMTVPLDRLKALTDDLPVPSEVDAAPGDRIHTAGVYVQGNILSPSPAIQSWLTPLDSTAGMDFLVPASAGAPGGGGGGGGGTPSPAPSGTPSPTPAPGGGTPSPTPAPTPGAGSGGGGSLPTTGGGLAVLALMTLAGAAATRRRQ